MKRKGAPAPAADEVRGLVAHAAKHGIPVDADSIMDLARLEWPASLRKLDRLLGLIRVAGHEGHALTVRQALARVDESGGSVEEALRRTIRGGPELRPGVAEVVEYAASRGVDLSPGTVSGLLRDGNRHEVERHVDDLAAILEAARENGITLGLVAAGRRLHAKGDAGRVIAELRAKGRRREDRRRAKCWTGLAPREFHARANALARCGCPRCVERLVDHLQPYISKVVNRPLFARYGRDEARSVAYEALFDAIDEWPDDDNGNFAAWHAKCFKNRVLMDYRARAKEEKMRSLDPLDDDGGGRFVPLAHRVPDRSCDVLTIVLARERLRSWVLQWRQECADRGDEFMEALHSYALELLADGGATATA